MSCQAGFAPLGKMMGKGGFVIFIRALVFGATLSCLVKAEVWRELDGVDASCSQVTAERGHSSSFVLPYFRSFSTDSFAMRIDSVLGATGDTAIVPVQITNAIPIGGFEMRISYDPTVETLLSVSRGVRITNWELFSARILDTFGFREIHLVAIANTIVSGNTPPMPEGSGPVVYLNFEVKNLPNISGFFLPLFFVSHDSTDNAMSDSSGYNFIGQNRIRYYNGGINLISTGVQDDSGHRPSGFWLGQNFPNRFNPQTTITFFLPAAEYTKLVVYDVLGRTVATLLDQRLSAGQHTVVWNGRSRRAEEVSSGVYFYRIIAGDFRETKKMILVK